MVVADGGYVREMTVCEDCLDNELIIGKRRAIPGECEVCDRDTL